MARRRKRSAAPKRRRRRSVGAVASSKNVLMTVAGIAGGAIAARLIGNYAGKMGGGLNPKIVSAGQVALGIFFPKFVKGKLGQDLGAGMVAVGGLSLAQSFGIISGIGAYEEDMEVTVSGTDMLSPINGYGEDFGFSDTMNGTGGSSDLDVISGMDEYSY
jgi:hypothetical protein